MKNDKNIVVPFLKWAGGKRWLVAQRPDLFSGIAARYIEPFLGGGAVYFHIKPKDAILTDVNPELINAYREIRDHWMGVDDELMLHHGRHSKDYYYKIRGESYCCPTRRAAQFIYLNRTCWNGLYRVNRYGKFNVPVGTKSAVRLDTDNFDVMSKLLKGADVYVSDFGETISLATVGDLVFADPPYTVKHNNNGFVKYNETLFSWSDQVRLKHALAAAKRRGARIVSSNADHESVWDLYSGEFDIQRVWRASVISGKAQTRGQVSELIITG